MKKLLVSLMFGISAIVLAGCATQQTANPNEVSQLSTALRSLSPGVDQAEADRAAQIAYEYGAQLARQYDVTDNPIIHNTKVNMGVKERGLCVHYATDMQERLNQENFQTLDVLRAIAEPRNGFRISHSTALIAPKGEDIYKAIVLDPWRNSGYLYWAPTREDPRYDWEPQMEVLRRRSREKAAKEAALEG